MALVIISGILILAGLALVIGGARYAKSRKKAYEAAVEDWKQTIRDIEVEEAEREKKRSESRDYYSRGGHITRPAAPDEEHYQPYGGWLTAIVGAALAVITFIVLGLNSFYTQDVGEAKVLVTWDGKVAGQSTEPGFHLKSPLESVKTFDVRNNLVTYVGADGEDVKYAGNERTGPQVTFQDREGVSGNMDVTVRYALDPTKVSDIYTQFRTQENLVLKVINEAVRGEARKATTTRNTIEVYNDRAGVEADYRALLEDRINVDGFIIEEVTVQEIDYGPEIRARFEEAQAARVAVDKAEAEQDAAEVQAQTRVIEAKGLADAQVEEAKGQAEANDLLTKSLSPEILTQRWVDALDEGTVFVVEPGSTPLVQVTP